MIQATATTKQLIKRPPVVVVLGHIDHGKTTLLDNIRKSSVVGQAARGEPRSVGERETGPPSIVAGETGGITQHIGAYHIEHNNKAIAFIDTPGHEAFTKMRSRGAKVADAAVLIVAADDGVKPQTIEAINIIKETKIPFVVAINKVDKPEANIKLVKQQLSEHEVFLEDWGGKIPSQEISAKTGQGIDELLDLILLVTDLEDLKADSEVPASGIIIESHLETKRGYVATLLIKNGSLKVGDFIGAEDISGKIKSLEDPNKQTIKLATFLTPAVVVVGFGTLPPLGAEFKVFHNKNDLAEYLRTNNTKKEKIKSKIQTPALSDKKVLNIILKADKQGTLEAIEKSLTDIKIEILSAGVGNVSENDIKLASSTNSSIFAFKIKLSSEIKNLAEQFNVKVDNFNIIYELLEAVGRELEEFLGPQIQKIILGRVKILATFKDTAQSQIVGGRVTSGVIKKGAKASLIRNNEIFGVGTIPQLQQNKQDISEVQEGSECGLMFVPENSKVKVQQGDILEIFEQKTIKPTLNK